MKLRSISTGAAATLAATALLTGVAFASSNATDTTDNDGADRGASIAKLAKTTTTTGEAKGGVISAAAKTTVEANENDAEDTTDTDAEDTDAEDTDTDDNDATDADSHGDTISALAKSTEPGPEHGATVSAAARKGHGSH